MTEPEAAASTAPPSTAPAAPDREIVSVVAQFDRLLERDGTRLEIEGVVGEELQLRLVAEAGDCEACSLSPSDLEILVADALSARGSAVTRVRVAE